MKLVALLALLVLAGCKAESADEQHDIAPEKAPVIVRRAELRPTPPDPDTEEFRIYLAACHPGTTEADVLQDHPPSNYSIYPPEVRAAIRRADIGRSICRGVSGRDTARACNRWSEATREVKKLGWCWGSEDRNASGFERHWLPCSKDPTYDKTSAGEGKPYFSAQEVKEWEEAYPVYPEGDLKIWAARCDEF